MYKRIRDGLVDPKKIVNYIGDKVLYPILFIVIFTIVMTIPTVFNCINYEVPYETKSTFIDALKDETINFVIKDGKLEATSSDKGYVKESTYYALIIGEGKTSNQFITILKLDTDSAYLQFGIAQVKLFDYIDYENCSNLDLNKLTSGQNETWDQVFKVVNSFIDDNPGVFIVLPVIITLISNAFSLVIVALIIALGALLRLRNTLKFRAIFKFSIYCLEPFIIGSLIDSLFGINFIYIIGVIITFIYSYICQIEVLKKVYSHHTEG